MHKKIKFIFVIFIILFLSINSLYMIQAQDKTDEISVIGRAKFGADPDRMYQEAFADAFNKAYIKKYQEKNLLELDQEIKDPVLIQKELGVSDYRILRFWQTGEFFYMEIKIVLGGLKNNTIQGGNLRALPKENWFYQTSNPIISVAQNNLALAVNTTQTIDLVDSKNGKALKKVKTGPGEHDAVGDQYVVIEKDYLKASNFSKVNFLKLGYLWRRKFPEIHKFFLTENTILLIEKTGWVKALNWEDGSIEWNIAAPELARIISVDIDRFLFIFKTPEIWMINRDGQKIWSQELESNLNAEPVSRGNELYCLLNNGVMKILDVTSGIIIGTWKLGTYEIQQNTVLAVKEKEVILSFNDKDQHGHLQIYQRYTGSLQWETVWNQAVIDMVVTDKDLIIIGIENVLEAREICFGLKAWNLPVNRKITKIYNNKENLTVIAENRIYFFVL